MPSEPVARGAETALDPFLVGDEAEWIAGYEFVVGGGLDARRPWARWPVLAGTERPFRYRRRLDAARLA